MPPHIKGTLVRQKDISELIEVILDMGRQPEARFPRREEILSEQEVGEADIDHVVTRISKFARTTAPASSVPSTASPPSATGGAASWG
jgi:stage III sporulation protein SpoIIIAA